MYAQRRITDQVHGSAFTSLEALSGKINLELDIKENLLNGDDHLTALHVPLESGVNPEDLYTETPYEKGFIFLKYLCKQTGSVDAFDGFLKAYAAKFAFKSISAQDMLAYFDEYFPHLKHLAHEVRPTCDFPFCVAS